MPAFPPERPSHLEARLRPVHELDGRSGAMLQFQSAPRLRDGHGAYRARARPSVHAPGRIALRSESMPAVGGTTYFSGRPLRRALIARARAGDVPGKWDGILAGGIVPRAMALACVKWLGEPRLIGCLRPTDPPGIPVDRLDAALRRHDTSLVEVKQDAHLRDDHGPRAHHRPSARGEGTVSAELVERILRTLGSARRVPHRPGSPQGLLGGERQRDQDPEESGSAEVAGRVVSGAGCPISDLR